LIGPRLLPSCSLDRLPNVHFLPPVPYGDVPAVLHALDVAMIPYLVNRLTLRINPLKLRECLASGVPLVVSKLPEAARYSDVLEIATSVAEWKEALARALAEGRSRAAARSSRVREESWEARAEEFSRQVLETEALVRPA
jgi:glycosyltransferase involved in cell wall biosynthesis